MHIPSVCPFPFSTLAPPPLSQQAKQAFVISNFGFYLPNASDSGTFLCQKSTWASSHGHDLHMKLSGSRHLKATLPKEFQIEGLPFPICILQLLNWTAQAWSLSQ